MKKIITAVVSLLLLGFIGSRFLVSAVYIYDRDIGNQERISDAFLAFYRAKNIAPESLKQLAELGYLPMKGAFYKEPPDFWGRESSVESSSYKIFPITADSSDKLRILGRKSRDGSWSFDPPINAKLQNGIAGLKVSHDAIIQEQAKRKSEPHKPTKAR